MSIYEEGVAAAKDFYAKAQQDKYKLDSTGAWVYDTFTIPRPNEDKKELGRHSPVESANAANRQLVLEFISKHKIDVAAPGLISAVTAACVAEWGQDAWDKACEGSRQRWRLAEFIASWIEQTSTWAESLQEFVENDDSEIRRSFKELCDRDIKRMVRTAPDSNVGLLNFEVGYPLVMNVKSQDVIVQKSKMIMINASAGQYDQLSQGGGTFGDPWASLTTQEEDVYRTIPYHVKFFVQFVLSKYVYEVDVLDKGILKERASKFAYFPEFAPRNGRAIVIPPHITEKVSSTYYFLSAANDQTKTPISDKAAKKLTADVFSCAFQVAAEYNISMVIGGAFGLGVFRGAPRPFAWGVLAAKKKHHSEYGQPCGLTIAYFHNPEKDKVAALNFKLISEQFHQR